MLKPYIADKSVTYNNVKHSSDSDCLMVLLNDICVPDCLEIDTSKSNVFRIIDRFRCSNTVNPKDVYDLVSDANLYDALTDWDIDPDVFAMTLYRYVVYKFNFVPLHDYDRVVANSSGVDGSIFNWLIRELINLLEPFYN